MIKEEEYNRLPETKDRANKWSRENRDYSAYNKTPKRRKYQKEYDKKHFKQRYENNKKRLELTLNLIKNDYSLIKDIWDYHYTLYLWGLRIKERDNNTCQICNSVKKLHAHHIFYKTKYPQLSLNFNNGITLCEKCHKFIHSNGIK